MPNMPNIAKNVNIRQNSALKVFFLNFLQYFCCILPSISVADVAH
jgi:hypothetical protein